MAVHNDGSGVRVKVLASTYACQMGHVRKSVYLMDVSAGFLQGYKVVGLLAATLTIRLHNAFTRPDHGGIRAGELSAIRRGLRATLNLHPVLRDTTGTLTVLTDFRAAPDLLERSRTDEAPSEEDGRLSTRIPPPSRLRPGHRHQLRKGPRTRRQSMNGLADRLATLALRNREMGVAEVAGARMVDAGPGRRQFQLCTRLLDRCCFRARLHRSSPNFWTGCTDQPSFRCDTPSVTLVHTPSPGVMTLA